MCCFNVSFTVKEVSGTFSEEELFCMFCSMKLLISFPFLKFGLLVILLLIYRNCTRKENEPLSHESLARKRPGGPPHSTGVDGILLGKDEGQVERRGSGLSMGQVAGVSMALALDSCGLAM